MKSIFRKVCMAVKWCGYHTPGAQAVIQPDSISCCLLSSLLNSLWSSLWCSLLDSLRGMRLARPWLAYFSIAPAMAHVRSLLYWRIVPRVHLIYYGTPRWGWWVWLGFAETPIISTALAAFLLRLF